MKTNHRRRDKKRKDGKGGIGVADVKKEARSGRRSSDRAALDLIKKSADADDVVFHTKDIQISNLWNWD